MSRTSSEGARAAASNMQFREAPLLAPRQQPLPRDTGLKPRYAPGFVAAAVLSCSFWALVGTLGRDGGTLVVFVVVLVLVACLALLTRRRTVAALGIMAYLAAVQPAIRYHAPLLPYLFLEYTLPLLALLIIGNAAKRGGAGLKSGQLPKPLLMYGFYLVLEVLDSFRSSSFETSRAVFVPSLALFVYLLISAYVELDAADLRLIVNGLLVGAISIAVLIVRYFMSGQIVRWSTNSNFAATAGMGPNQISFIFSVAAFLFLILSERQVWWTKLLYRALATGLIYLMILTFSRGGLYILVGALLLYYIILRRPSARTVVAFLVLTLVIMLVFQVAIRTTRGVAIQRYAEFTTSNRLLLVQNGWRIFLDHPLTGVGTGNYYEVVALAQYFGRTSGAHNELIRAAAEHGILGLVTWSMFALTGVLQVMRKRSSNQRRTAMVILVLALVSMFYNGLKLTIQPLLICLALSSIARDEPAEETRATDVGAASTF